MSLRRISILVATGVLVAAPGAVAGGLPKLPSTIGPPGKGDLQVKPSSIVYSGDGSAFLAGAKKSNHRDKPLKWSSWTATGAHGSGFNWLNNCKPNCAAGTFRAFPVKLHAYRARRVHGHRIFTRLKVTYTGAEPAHTTSRTNVWRVVFNSGGYFYNFSE